LKNQISRCVHPKSQLLTDLDSGVNDELSLKSTIDSLTGWTISDANDKALFEGLFGQNLSKKETFAWHNQSATIECTNPAT